MNHEIVTQRIILVVSLVSGYYFILCSPINYYGIASTILLVLTFSGGLIANRSNSNHFADNGYSPTVSVIIPAKDEETNIYYTIGRYAKIRYPSNKLEVIVIDDGSRDKTWHEIQKAIKDFPTSKVKAFSFTQNQGKRKALSYGIKQASGEILVTTDSDTFVHEDCIRLLVQPFVDEEVAGVTGHTYVSNEKKNVLTRMQAGLYFYAYRVVRSFESAFGTVLCLPGTLSAFRKKFVLDVLGEWENSKPVLGEDRHLTYLLLRKGYKTFYVKEAKCETVVPENFRRYLSQQLRWAKGYLIETLRGCRYMFRRHPIVALCYYSQYFLTLYLSLAIVRILCLFATGSRYWWGYFAFVGIAFFFKALYSCHASGDKSCWAMSLFLFINLLMNSWRIPLALLSVSEDTKWTR